MTGPVLMNQVLYQTPTVEKIQVVEQQNPDQIQRQASVEALAQLRRNTETVPSAPRTEESRVVERHDKEQEKRGRKKKSRPSMSEPETQPKPTEPDSAAGTIVNLVV